MVSASACHSEESLSEASPPRGSCHPEGEVFSFSPDQAVPRGAAAAGKSFDEKGGPHNVPSDRSTFPYHVDDHHRGRPRAHRRSGLHVEVLGHVHAQNGHHRHADRSLRCAELCRYGAPWLDQHLRRVAARHRGRDALRPGRRPARRSSRRIHGSASHLWRDRDHDPVDPAAGRAACSSACMPSTAATSSPAVSSRLR